MITTEQTRTHSTLATLRDQVPDRALSSWEVRQLLERQATRLLKLCDVPGPAGTD